jgi:cellulose synthase/poly-beta-1,6-N-acetylglucosamine synthase-like glycosyltransferase
VASVAPQLADGDELIVAEAGDSAAAAALASLGDPSVGRVVSAVGLAKTRRQNAAVNGTSAEIVLFTDDDCRVGPGWIDGLVSPFDDPTVGIAYGPVRGLTHLPGSGEPVHPPPGEAPLVPWTYAHGASFAIRRSALIAVDGFDERLGPGAPPGSGEDHDILLRLREHGWRAVIADAPPVEHLDWRSSEQAAANALVYERGSGAFLGAALRRSPRGGWPLFKHRLGYERQLLADRTGPDRAFARQAIRAFAGGLLYGVRLRPWR